MKFITKLNINQVKKLLKDEQLSDVFIMPLTDDAKGLIRNFLEENTGFDNQPVMGLAKINDKEGLENCWNEITIMIPIKEGDFILEFDMPDDMIAVIGYNSLTSIIFGDDKVDLISLEDQLQIEEHVDSSEFAFTSMIMLKYCTGFKLIGPNWEKEDKKLEPVSKLKTSTFF